MTELPHQKHKERDRIRIAIVGGGLAGLTLALALRRFSASSSSSSAPSPLLDVHVFEKDPNFTPNAGSGMVFWPRACEILDRLGVGTGFDDISTSGAASDIAIQVNPPQSKSGKPSSNPYLLTLKKDAGSQRTFHRANLLTMIALHLPRSSVHFSTPLASISPSKKGVELRFTDGSSANADIAIAADGLYSPIRSSLFSSSAASPYFTNQTLFRALIPTPLLKSASPNHPSLYAPQIFLGDGAYIHTWVVSHGSGVNFVLVFDSSSSGGGIKREDDDDDGRRNSPVKQVTRKGIEEMTKNWSADVRTLIKLLPPNAFRPSPNATPTYPINALKPLSSYVKGRVALIGDAAHAPTPSLSLGPTSALEDVLTLAAILTHPKITRDNLDVALQVYDSIRNPDGTQLLNTSSNTSMWLCSGPTSSSSMFVERARKNFEWLRYASSSTGGKEEWSAEREIQRAKKGFESRVGGR